MTESEPLMQREPISKSAHNWEVILDPEGRRHVRPIRDRRRHEHCDCWCQPHDDDGVWVHHLMQTAPMTMRSGRWRIRDGDGFYITQLPAPDADALPDEA